MSRLTPVLRPQVQMHRQLFRGEPWHVVHDPVTNNFFRLNPVAHHFVGLFDGRRSVDDAWRLTLERYGDAAPTQNEVIGLLGQLNETNLLRVDLPAEASQLLQRQRRRRLRFWGGQLMSILSLKIPAFNPNRLLDWLLPVFRPVLSRGGLVLWAAWLLYCLYDFLPSLPRFSTDLQKVLDPTNWGWMMLMFVLIKAWHELGHGLVCKRFGGNVPEVGIMLLVLFPAPYVDATSSWNFGDKWKRLLVAAAGMIFELALAGVAALLWLRAEPGSLLADLSRNAVVVASITTILFNANPLLRFDGYYILSDLLEVPNLYDRSGRHLRWLAQRYLFGMPGAQPVSTSLAEEWILAVYGVLSQVYRVMIMFGIALVVANKVPTLGILIGAWGIVAWAVIPSVKFLHWLFTGPALRDHRARAIGVTFGAVAAAVVVLGLVPVPDRRRANGVVESTARAELAVRTDGFVARVLAESGQRVEKDQAILVADNPELRSYQKELTAQLAELEVQEAKAVAQDPVARNILPRQIQATREQLAEANLQLEDLTLRSPQAGVLVGPPMASLVGQFCHKGQVLGRIEGLGPFRVTAVVDQAENATPFADGIETVEVRTASNLDTAIPSRVLWASKSGQTRLPHPALGFPGGGSVATDPKDEKGLTAERPQFEMWIDLPADAADRQGHLLASLPGERAYLRFTLKTRRPLLTQWVHRLHQIIRERLSV